MGNKEPRLNLIIILRIQQSVYVFQYTLRQYLLHKLISTPSHPLYHAIHTAMIADQVFTFLFATTMSLLMISSRKACTQIAISLLNSLGKFGGVTCIYTQASLGKFGGVTCIYTQAINVISNLTIRHREANLLSHLRAPKICLHDPLIIQIGTWWHRRTVSNSPGKYHTTFRNCILQLCNSNLVTATSI